jgi:hypothetical protein
MPSRMRRSMDIHSNVTRACNAPRAPIVPRMIVHLHDLRRTAGAAANGMADRAGVEIVHLSRGEVRDETRDKPSKSLASILALTSAQATTGLSDSGARAPRGEQQREVSCTNGTIAIDVGCS